MVINYRIFLIGQLNDGPILMSNQQTKYCIAMKLMNFLLTVLFTFSVSMVMAQSDQKSKRIEKRIDKLEQTLTSTDSNTALSDAQKDQLRVIYGEQMQEAKAIRTNNPDKEARKPEMRALAKTYRKRIGEEVLNDAQRAAWKSAKKNKRVERASEIE